MHGRHTQRTRGRRVPLTHDGTDACVSPSPLTHDRWHRSVAVRFPRPRSCTCFHGAPPNAARPLILGFRRGETTSHLGYLSRALSSSPSSSIIPHPLPPLPFFFLLLHQTRPSTRATPPPCSTPPPPTASPQPCRKGSTRPECM